MSYASFITRETKGGQSTRCINPLKVAAEDHKKVYRLRLKKPKVTVIIFFVIFYAVAIANTFTIIILPNIIQQYTQRLFHNPVVTCLL